MAFSAKPPRGAWVGGVEGVGGRLRRPFRGGGFLRASASPRGGA